MPVKPTEKEEAYFVRREVEKQHQNLLKTEERLKLKDLHYM